MTSNDDIPPDLCETMVELASFQLSIDRIFAQHWAMVRAEAERAGLPIPSHCVASQEDILAIATHLRRHPAATLSIVTGVQVLTTVDIRRRRALLQMHELIKHSQRRFGHAATIALVDEAIAKAASDYARAAALQRRREAQHRAAMTQLRNAARHREPALARLAGWMAGPRHSHLRTAWLADLASGPEAGIDLSRGRRLALTSGFVLAAARIRIRDAGRSLWVPVDWVLVSRDRTRLGVAVPVAALAVYIDVTGGLHELLTTGVQTCAVAAPSLWGLTRWLRRVRGIELSQLAEARRQERTGPSE
ncbi:hypothetical protein ACFV4P_34480 [Kitasatospora sp. NPDC059795]|uniref:hypothetical protein n=1 Tax=Kitasatospora sp. NPDC059795 TaxID=3346949 RepID=UPI00365B1CC9